MKVTQSQMFPRWRRPKPKPFEPEGLCLGATVIASARPFGGGRSAFVRGQVWSQAEKPGYRPGATHGGPVTGWWWIVAEGVAYIAHKNDIQVVGQCVEVSLIETEAVA